MQTDKQIDKQTDTQADKQTDRQIKTLAYSYVRAFERLNVKTYASEERANMANQCPIATVGGDSTKSTWPHVALYLYKQGVYRLAVLDSFSTAAHAML